MADGINDPDGLRYYQREAVDAILEELRENRSTLLDLATGLGKAQPNTARVLTPNGWTTMGEIAVGDLVIGSSGLPCRVLGVFPQGPLPVYRVVFSDDTEARCCGDHLWAVRTKSDKSRGVGYRVRATRELISDLTDGSGAAKWFVPVAAPAHLNERELPVDPWLLGALLGDGCMRGSGSVVISSADDFILRRCEIASGLSVRKMRPGSDDYDYLLFQGRVGRRGGALTKALRAAGVFGKLAHEKRVPADYLSGSVRQRLELLRGLMDTDGYSTGCGAEITTSSPGLAEDLAELARSLGGTTTIRVRRTQCRPAYRLRMNTPDNPFSLPRKADLYRGDGRAMRSRAISAVVPDGDAPEPCTCIAVDAPDRLYVTNDYVLTHNTQVFSVVAKYWPGDVLVLAHRDELIEQARARLESMLGVHVGVEKAEMRADPMCRVVVGSVQSMNSRRLEGMERNRFSLIIVDECHHATSPSYRRVFDWFLEAKILGVTATPDRSDGKALGQIFDSVAYRMGIGDGIEAGYLVPLIGKAVHLDELDISDVGKTGKDLAAGELDEKMLEVVEPIVHGIIEHGEGRQGIVFCPGVRSAALAAERMNVMQPDSARFVSGETERDERALIVRDFREGRFKYLFNCMVATEGFDAPTANLVVLARPTLSRSLMAQMVGRGTRTLPGVVESFVGTETNEERRAAIDWSAKPNTLILDFVGNSGKHSLMSPIDALAGDYTEAELKRAKKKQGGDLRENLKRARIELREMAKVIESKAKTTATEFDPFSVLGVERDREAAFDEEYGRVPPTPSQVYAARNRGMTTADLNGLSRHALNSLLTKDFNREKNGWATYAQMRVLRRYPGMPEKGVRIEHAQAALDHIQKGWQYPSSIDPATVVAIAKGEV